MPSHYDWGALSGHGQNTSMFGMADYANFLQQTGGQKSARDALIAAEAAGQVQIAPGSGRDYILGTGGNQATGGSKGLTSTGEQAGGSTEYTGHVDVLHQMASGKTAGDIKESAVWNPEGGAGIHGLTGLSNVVNQSAQNQAQQETLTTQSTNIGNLQTDLKSLQDKYDDLGGNYEGLTGKYETLLADVAKANQLAQQVKISSPTAVGGGGPGTIRFAQSPGAGKGSAGTGSFARPASGLQIHGINI